MLGLVLASVFLTNESAQGVASNSDVSVAIADSGNATNTTHILGQSVNFQGSVSFANEEQNTLTQVVLANTTGAQALNVRLPLIDTDGAYVTLDADTYSLAIDSDGLDKSMLDKEKEIIIEELKNSGKDSKIVDKIAIGKLNKFISDNTLLNQFWIMEPKKKVKEILNEKAGQSKIKIKKFIRYKVGEGI